MVMAPGSMKFFRAWSDVPARHSYPVAHASTEDRALRKRE